MNILYLDDNDDVIRLAVNKLTKYGHTVHAVQSIEEATEILKAEKGLDVFIADPHLPSGNCLDLFMGLNAEYEKLKFCVVSHSVSRSESNQLRMADIPFYEKPVLIDKVVEGFRKVPPGVKVRKVTRPPLSLR